MVLKEYAEVGDTIVTCLDEYIVEQVVNERGVMYVPEGANEYTYLVPHENVVEIKRKYS